MPGSHLFNFGLGNVKSISKNNDEVVIIGSSRGRGGSVRTFNHCKNNSSNPSLCINQFLYIKNIRNVSSNRLSDDTVIQTAPEKPLIVSITPGINQLTVNFNRIPGLTYYYSIKQYIEDEYSDIYVLPISNKIVELNYGLTYNVKIRAENNVGYSVWSDAAEGSPSIYSKMDNGFNNQVRSIILKDDFVIVSGDFTKTAQPNTTQPNSTQSDYNHLAGWRKTDDLWKSFSGTDTFTFDGSTDPKSIRSIVQYKDTNDIYIGGNFIRYANSILLNGIAKLNTDLNTLTAIAESGVNPGDVYTIAYNNKNETIYFGGNFFADACGNDLPYIGSIDHSSNTIVSLENSNINLPVYCITIDNNSDSDYNGHVYIGGEFGVTGVASNIAYYDPIQNIWNYMSGGVSGSVHAIAIDPTSPKNIYVGGNFQEVGNQEVGVVSVNNIACYNVETEQWSALMSQTASQSISYGPVFTSPSDPLLSAVYTIAVASDGTVYVGGKFNQIKNDNALNVNNIAKWHPNHGWSNVSVQPINSDGVINVITIDKDDILYVGGAIHSISHETNSEVVNNIYQFLHTKNDNPEV